MKAYTDSHMGAKVPESLSRAIDRNLEAEAGASLPNKLKTSELQGSQYDGSYGCRAGGDKWLGKASLGLSLTGRVWNSGPCHALIHDPSWSGADLSSIKSGV
jgi:hypothetical protein